MPAASAAASPDPAAPRDLRAFGDESGRFKQPHGSYILAAAVLAADAMAAVRTELQALLLAGQRRIHWRDEDEARQRKIASVVAEVEALHYVVAGSPADPRKQERARRQCLEHLLWVLDHDLGASHLVLESRQPERDRKDLQALTYFRKRGVLTQRLRVDHAMPVQEPLLWLPDIGAGAVSAARDGAGECLQLLAPVVTVHEIDLR